jgi:hypothetical protein
MIAALHHAASMSSAVANPDSIMRMAERMYGMSRALTTKPARSWLRITRLCSTSVAKRFERSVVSGEVSKDVTSSTRRNTGTGLKKWMPMTCSGRWVAMPSFMIGIELVLLANRLRVGDDRIELAEHLGLHRLVLDDGFHDQLAVGEVGEVGGEGELGDRGVAGVLAELAGPDTAVEAGDEAAAATLARLRADLQHEHFAAGAGAHFGDAGTHQARADDADSVNCFDVIGFTHRTPLCRIARVIGCITPTLAV